MIKLLDHDQLVKGFDGTFAASIDSGTFPAFKLGSRGWRIVLAVLEAMLILYNDGIFPTITSGERPIDQDFVFFENNICDIPLCKVIKIFIGTHHLFHDCVGAFAK